MNLEAHIARFLKTYKYLTEERDWSFMDVANELKMGPPTLKKLISATKATIPELKLRGPTLAKMQDFSERFREEVGAFEHVGAATEDLTGEYTYRADNIESESVRPKTIGECDEFDLLRALKAVPGVNVSFTVSLQQK